MTHRRPNLSSRIGRSLAGLVLPILLAGALSTCGSSPTAPTYVTDTGTVVFLDVEGGCWIIEGNDDTYEPSNLPEHFKEDGLGVSFLSRLEEDQASTCQAGTRIRLISISVFEP